MIKLKRQKAFTLTELIVVIAIIGILAAVLIPSLTGYISKSKKSAAEQEAASVYKIYQAWQAESKVTSKYYPELVGQKFTVTGGAIVLDSTKNDILSALGVFAVYYAEATGVALTGILTTDSLKKVNVAANVKIISSEGISIKNIILGSVSYDGTTFSGFTMVASNGYKVEVTFADKTVDYEVTENK